jgi:hypothetical protein
MAANWFANRGAIVAFAKEELTPGGHRSILRFGRDKKTDDRSLPKVQPFAES